MVGIKSSELSSLTISKIWRHMPVNKQKSQLWKAKHHMYNCYQRLHQEVHNNSLSMFKLCWFYIYWCLSHYLKREHGLNGDLMIIGVCWEKIGKSCKLCPVRFPSHESALCQEAHTHTSHGQRSPTQVIMGTFVSVFTGLLGPAATCKMCSWCVTVNQTSWAVIWRHVPVIFIFPDLRASGCLKFQRSEWWLSLRVSHTLNTQKYQLCQNITNKTIFCPRP